MHRGENFMQGKCVKAVLKYPAYCLGGITLFPLWLCNPVAELGYFAVVVHVQTCFAYQLISILQRNGKYISCPCLEALPYIADAKDGIGWFMVSLIVCKKKPAT